MSLFVQRFVYYKNGRLIEKSKIDDLKEKSDKYIIKVNDANNIDKLIKNEKIEILDDTTILIEIDKEKIFNFAKN